MKKLLFIGLLASAFSVSAFAKPLICPFTDYFTVTAPVGYQITSLSTDGNVIAYSQSSRNFTTGCRENTSRDSGKVYLTVASDHYNLCTIHIIDGPYEMNPSIQFINCLGRLKYMGMDHVWGTYTYTLKFNS